MMSTKRARSSSPDIQQQQPITFAGIHSSDSSLHPAKFCRRHQQQHRGSKSLRDLLLTDHDQETLPDEEKLELERCMRFYQKASGSTRQLFLSYVLADSCIPQLTYLYNNLPSLLHVDVLSLLPCEIAIRILSFLDAKSLCRAAQVSRAWNCLANDNTIWHRLCEQHIDRKCHKCGWGLPLMPKKDSSDSEMSCSESHQKTQVKKRVWKHVYSERLYVEQNWRNNRYNHSVIPAGSKVICLQFDNTRVVAGLQSGLISCWNVSSCEKIRDFEGHLLPVTAIQYDRSKLISGSLDGLIKVWDMATGECVRSFHAHDDGVTALQFDKEILVTGSVDGSCRIWNCKTRSSFSINLHSSAIRQIQLDKRSKLFSCAEDSTVKIWDLNTRSVLRSFEGHFGVVSCLKPAPYRYELAMRVDHPVLFTGGLDSTVRMWDSVTGKQLARSCEHEDSIYSLDADCLHLVTGGKDKNLIIWDIQSLKPLHSIPNDDELTCVRLNDVRVVFGVKDNIVIHDYSKK